LLINLFRFHELVSYDMLQTSDALDLMQQSTSSSEYSPDVPSVTKPQRVYSHVKMSLFGKDSESPQLSGVSLLESTSHQEPTLMDVLEAGPSTSSGAGRIFAEKSYVLRGSKETKTTVPNRLSVRRQKHASVETQHLYKRARILQQRVAKMKNRQISLKQQVTYLQSKKSILTHLKNVNETTGNFILSQLQNQKFTPRGRRYTIEDKILALSIFKQSGKGYRYLSKFFCLPSRKSLTTMLNKIPFYCGVNQSIFEHLKKRVDKMSNINKFCILMFDEVSLSLGLNYCSRRDSVDGFFDYGGANRRLQFADHALAFIVKGIHKKWKQVVWYSFCEGTTPTADLRHIIKTVVDQLATCGLNLVATISDQGSTNRAAVNQLILDTRCSLEGSPRSNYPDPGVLVYEVNNC
jgi:hypothetical protein